MKQFNIAIVGHTNTGKTSLIRTLTRERNFGEVRDEASTTIDVSAITLSSDSIEFNYIDTPGLEDAMGILEILDAEHPIQQKIEETTRLKAFIEDTRFQQDFEQEIKVIKQLFNADLTLYVIDARLPFLPKFNDEITLILQTHKPLLPILNFLEGEHLADWKQHLKAHGIHHYLEFDTVMPPQMQRLYEQIAIMFPELYDEIHQFIALEKMAEEERFEEAMQLLANYFINLMTFQIKAKKRKAAESISRKMAKGVEHFEKGMIDSLLSLYRFNREDVKYLKIDVEQSRFNPDFFTADNLIDFSMQFGKGASVGAGVMAGVDAIAGFTTLGAATATGAILGGISSTFKHYGSRLLNDLQDIETYCLNDEAVANLSSRMLLLIALLSGRSHADLRPIELEITTEQSPIREIIASSQSLRTYYDFCEIRGAVHSSAREKALFKLKEKFIKAYQSMIGFQHKKRH